MIRKHWTPDEQGMVQLSRCGEPVMVSVQRLDAIAAGHVTHDFYMEWAAAKDLPLDPNYSSQGGKTGQVRRPRKRTATPDPAPEAQLALI